MGMYDKLLQEDKRPLQSQIPRTNVPSSLQTSSVNPEEGQLTNLGTYEATNLETKEPTNLGKKEPRSLETYKSTNLETKESRKKGTPNKKKTSKQYNALLTVESILAIKRLGLEEDKKDYQIVQEAIDQYLKKKGF